MKYILFIIFTIISLNVFANPPILTNSLDQAIALQKNINHDIILIFSSDKCVYCKLLKEDLSKMDIQDKIICIVDINKNTKLKDKYEVSLIPDTRIISNGREIKKIVGYANKTKYIELIK